MPADRRSALRSLLHFFIFSTQVLNNGIAHKNSLDSFIRYKPCAPLVIGAWSAAYLLLLTVRRPCSGAQIGRVSLRNSTVLVDLDEQTRTPDLPHDEPAFLQRRPEAARIAAYLV